MSVPFWVTLGSLGSFALTRPLWSWTMVIIGGYIVVDWLFEKLLDIRESRQGSGLYQAHVPPLGDRIVSAQKAYLVFVCLMLGTAVLSDLLVRLAQNLDAALTLWESSFMWSIPISALVALRLLGSYREGVYPLRRKR